MGWKCIVLLIFPLKNQRRTNAGLAEQTDFTENDAEIIYIANGHNMSRLTRAEHFICADSTKRFAYGG